MANDLKPRALAIWFSEQPQYFRDLKAAASWHEAWMLTFGRPGWKPNTAIQLRRDRDPLQQRLASK